MLPQTIEAFQELDTILESSRSDPFEQAIASSTLIIPRAPSLREPEMQCANSLKLTPHDRRLWDFFPSTTVFLFYDFGDCSTFRYVFSELARSSSIVMSMILATSANEMRKANLRYAWDSSSQHLDYGLYHYNVALNHMHSRLARYSNTRDEPNVEVLVASIFFMVNYEIQFPTYTSSQRIEMHLEGLWGLISTHPLFLTLNQDETMPECPKDRTAAANLSLSCQLIVWCLYVDHSITVTT
jgi:hypothetical protein